jgi:hypothetical protein
MPVTPPKSATTITKASITGMYDVVRAVVNDQSEDTITRGTFGEQHLPSLVQQADYFDVTTPFTVSGYAGPYGAGTPPPTFDEQTYGTWPFVTPYTMDNGGPGYTLNAGIVLMFAHIRWSTAGSSPSLGPIYQELWMNFNYTVNGVLTQLPINNRMLRNMKDVSTMDGDDTSWPGRVEETFSWWRVLDLRSLTPTFNFKMGVKAVPQRASGGNTTDCLLPNGGIGFVNLYGG